MFFILSKTISFLAMPATLIGLCWLAYFIFFKKHYRKYFAIAGFGLFIIFTNDFLANTFLKWWEMEPVPVENVLKQRKFQYGVVLTGMTNTLKEPKDRVYFHQNADRLLQAHMLFKQGAFDTLVISGGGATALRKDLQEARVLASYLETIGFPMERVKIEDESRNTYESAVNLKKIIPPKSRILLITSASHMPRANACFERQLFPTGKFPTVYVTSDNFISPAMFIPSDAALLKWHILFKELLGYVAYYFAEYI
jgi:uncharacterized SAM-binding protein YcdF (DUF218 family)